MAFDIKIKIDWRTTLIIVIAFFIYKIGIAIINYSKSVVPSVLKYINQQIIGILSDPFAIFLLVIFFVSMYLDFKKK